jgi:phospholipid/cholesterol/gamma-HCH transport system substrate-binding protein
VLVTAQLKNIYPDLMYTKYMNDKSKHHSTHYIHRTSYTAQERMVGVFVLSAIAVLVFLLFSTIKSQNIFEEYLVIYGKLNSAEGLSTETIVQISGIEVGKVSAVEITDDNHIMLTMHIYNRFHKLLRSDSKVKVSSLNATIIGKSIIGITAGSHDKPKLAAGSVLDVQESGSVEDVISEAKVILDVINKMVYQVSDVISAVDAEKIASTIDSFEKVAANVKVISDDLNSDRSIVKSLLVDKKLEENITQSMANLKQATGDMKELIQVLKSDVKEVPVVLKNINTVIGETEKTIQATQRIWPISSAMPEKEPGSKTVAPLPAND